MRGATGLRAAAVVSGGIPLLLLMPSPNAPGDMPTEEFCPSAGPLGPQEIVKNPKRPFGLRARLSAVGR
jgi:hypothetical protein